MHVKDFDFDHPNSLDFDLVEKCLREIITTRRTRVPLYSFLTNSPTGEYLEIECNEVFILEGILSLHSETLRSLFDLKFFILCDPDVALARRILRDIKERGRDVNEVLGRYNRFIRNDYGKYIWPQMAYADLVVPGGASNELARQIIVFNLKREIENRQSNTHTLFEELVHNFRDTDNQICNIIMQDEQNLNIKALSLFSEDKEALQKSIGQILRALFKTLFLQANQDPLLFLEFKNRKFDLFSESELNGGKSPEEDLLVVFLGILSEESIEKVNQLAHKNPFVISVLGHSKQIEKALQ